MEELISVDVYLLDRTWAFSVWSDDAQTFDPRTAHNPLSYIPGGAKVLLIEPNPTVEDMVDAVQQVVGDQKIGFLVLSGHGGATVDPSDRSRWITQIQIGEGINVAKLYGE